MLYMETFSNNLCLNMRSCGEKMQNEVAVYYSVKTVQEKWIVQTSVSSG